MADRRLLLQGPGLCHDLQGGVMSPPFGKGCGLPPWLSHRFLGKSWGGEDRSGNCLTESYKSLIIRMDFSTPSSRYILRGVMKNILLNKRVLEYFLAAFLVSLCLFIHHLSPFPALSKTLNTTLSTYRIISGY